MRVHAGTRGVIPWAPLTLACALACTALALSCSAEIPEGRLRCAAATDCPSGWVCRMNEAAGELRCYASAIDGGGRDGGGRDGGGRDGGGSRDGGAIDSGPEIDAGAPPCDAGELPDETTGVFVLAGAMGGDGSVSSPLGTIAAALPIARTGRPHIYIGKGRYAEALTISDPPTGLVLDGGWDVTGAIWERDCEDGRSGTLIVSPDAIGLRIEDAASGIELRHLMIETSPPGTAASDAPGGSRIGLLVGGANSAVTLYDVHVRARDAEAGGPASDGAAGGMPACDAVSGCSDGGAGGEGSRGPDAPAMSVFAADGYAPANGSPGTLAGPGRPGVAGGPSYRAATNCCGLCNGGGGCSTMCDAPADVPRGRCGCGGQPGEPGRGGPGGGASVGLLVSGVDAVVSARYSRIESGAGGAGAAGSAPGVASSPTVGAQGTAECCTTCRVEAACDPGCSCYRESCTTYTTPAGGPGGAAGTSGAGGGGAGGPSFAVVAIDGARYLGDVTSSLTWGAGGAGGGESNGGASGAVHPAP